MRQKTRRYDEFQPDSAKFQPYLSLDINFFLCNYCQIAFGNLHLSEAAEIIEENDC
jgi:hypothetical protein